MRKAGRQCSMYSCLYTWGHTHVHPCPYTCLYTANPRVGLLVREHACAGVYARVYAHARKGTGDGGARLDIVEHRRRKEGLFNHNNRVSNFGARDAEDRRHAPQRNAARLLALAPLPAPRPHVPARARTLHRHVYPNVDR